MRTLPVEVPEGPRLSILQTVNQTPGIHLRGIERATSLPLGQVVYHLDRLQRMGLVNSQKDGGFRRFYATNDVGRGEKRWIAALRHETPRRIVLELLDRPALTHKELREVAGVAGSTLTFHLQRLVDADVLEKTRLLHAAVYVIADRQALLDVLAEHHDSFDDERMTRIVIERSLDMPGPLPVPATAG